MSAKQAKATKNEEKAPVEKQTNCLNCNKAISKLKKYYRDGKFYCSKKCWRAFLKKSQEQKK